MDTNCTQKRLHNRRIMETINQLLSAKNHSLSLWKRIWITKNIGGSICFAGTFLTLSLISIITVHTWLLNQTNQRTLSQKALNHTIHRHTIEKQYHDALQQKSADIQRFNQTQLDTPTHLDDLKIQLKKWQHQFKIKTIDVTVKESAPLHFEPDLMNLSLTISVKILNDRSFYQFLNQLQQHTHGLIVIRHVDLKRTTKLTHETIDHLLSGKQTTLIDGKIDCNWIFLSAH